MAQIDLNGFEYFQFHMVWLYVYQNEIIFLAWPEFARSIWISTNICSHYDIQRNLFERSIKPSEGPACTYVGTLLGTKSEYSELQTFIIIFN